MVSGADGDEVRELVVRRVAVDVVNLEPRRRAADAAAAAVAGDHAGAQPAPGSRRSTPQAERLAACVRLRVVRAGLGRREVDGEPKLSALQASWLKPN
jgi:hypothetical protein